MSEGERNLWFLWKRAHEVIRTRVADDVRDATGLSEPDVAVLVQVDDAGGHVRQNRLAVRLGWDRTRLAHHLARMETRDLISRQKLDDGVQVILTATAQRLIDMIRPIHATAVRRHLIDPFTTRQVEHLREALDRISNDPTHD
ncbi:MarR family winged helix-turn-helix transcriptional regulator [Frondihabitans cladoniiphilus]|uniref:MarR family winged helix-turn-helix transcriptional regulator n=1 Tax=Frondihabitans cladoniiphilus TaxID=715785 RepID=A0ABP8W7X1_9MICO